MTPANQVPYIVSDCFFAVGQAVGRGRQLDPDAVAWWHDRYQRAFLDAMTHTGTSWDADRRRVTAVGRYLGLRVLHHLGDNATISIDCAARASDDIESTCQMNAVREGVTSDSAVA